MTTLALRDVLIGKQVAIPSRDHDDDDPEVRVQPGLQVAIPPGIMTTRRPVVGRHDQAHVAIPPGMMTTCVTDRHDWLFVSASWEDGLRSLQG